jgi:hypothetical protein
VEGMAYNHYLKEGLVKIVEEWRGLSDNTERLYKVLDRSSEESETLIQILSRLEERGWLDGSNAAERKAVLQ